MKAKLIIIGAGDVGAFVVKHIDDFGHYEILGILDDNQAKHGEDFCGFKVLGGLDYLTTHRNEDICIALATANPLAKAKILNAIGSESNLNFPSFIHPKVWLGEGVTVGLGTIIYPGVSINYETSIGDFCTINMNCAIGHNCALSTGVTLSPGVNLGGFTGIGEHSFLGIGASTIQGIIIGEESTIGGMSMVLKEVPDRTTVVGNPAKILKYKKNNIES